MRALVALLALPLVFAVSGSARAEDPPKAPPAPAAPAGLPADLLAKAEAALTKAAAFLKGKQGQDGSISPEKLPTAVGYTAMATTALVGATPKSLRDADAAISKALAYLA